MKVMILFIILCAWTDARPAKRHVLGDNFIRDGEKFIFNNDVSMKKGQLFDEDEDESKLMYSVEVKENVHSFDDDMSIESINCYDDYFIISTNDKSIENWAEGSLVTGSPLMWGCSSSMNKKVSKIIFLYEDDYYHYKLETKTAYLDEYFKSAKVLFYPTIKSQTNDVLNPQNLKNSNNSYHIKNNTFSNVIYKRVYDDNEVGSIVAPMTQIAYPIDSKPKIERLKKASSNPFTILSPSSLASVAGNEQFCVQFSLKKKSTLTVPITLTVKKVKLISNTEVGTYDCGSKTFKKGEIESCCFKINPNIYEDNEEYKIYFNSGDDYNTIEQKSFGFVVEPYQPLVITSPVSGQVFDMEKTKQFEVEWDFTKFDYKTVKMKLMRGRVGIDETVVTQTIKDINSKRDVLKIQSTTNLLSSTKYYIRFEYHCWDLYFYEWCSHVESDTFSYINSTQTGGIVITAPSLGKSYKTGDNIIITWENGVYDENEDLTISLKKDSGLFHGPFSSITAKGKDKKVTIPVPDLSDDTRYFIEMEYGSGIMKTYAYSDYFSINHEQVIEFKDDDIQYNSETKQLKISFRTTKYEPLDENYFITINKDLPMFLRYDPSDKTINIYDMEEEDKDTYYEYSITLNNYDGQTFLWKYVTFNYNCFISTYLCEHEYSRRFSVPINDIRGWNYDPKENKIINENMKIYSASCEKNCSSLEDKVKNAVLCKICDKKIDTTLDIDCKNCHIKTENGFGEFEFEMGPKGIGKAVFHVYGKLYTYFEFITKFSGKFSYDYQLDLFTYPIIGTPEINLGMVKLQFGSDIYAGIRIGFELDGDIVLRSGFEKEYQYYFDVTYPPTSMKPDEIGNEYAKMFIEETKVEKIFDVEAKIAAKLTFAPTIGIRASIEIVEIDGRFEFPLDNTLTFSYPAFPANPDASNSALYADGMNVPHYLEYDLDFKIILQFSYGINLLVWSKEGTKPFELFKVKLVKLGLVTLNDAKKLAQIPMKLVEDVFKYKDDSNVVINDIQKDVIKLVSDTTNVEIEDKDTFAGDTKQVNTADSTNSEIINVGFTNSDLDTEDIKKVCDKINDISSLGDDYPALKKYQQYIDGCGNIEIENPSLIVIEEPEPDPDVLIISPTEPINVEIGNYLSVKVSFGSRFNGQTISVTANCYFFFTQKNKLEASQTKTIKVSPSGEYSFDFETSSLSENAQYVVEIVSSSFETVSSPLFTIVEKTTGVYPVNIIIEKQPEEYEDLIIYKVSLRFINDMIGKNVPIKFEFKKSVYDDVIETFEVLPGEVIVENKIYDFEVKLTGSKYSYNGVYYPTISAEYSSGVNGLEFEVPFDTDIDGTILSCYPGPRSPLFTIFTVGECVKGRFGYFKAVKSGSNYIVNKYSHDKCSRSPDETDYYSEHECTTEPLNMKEIASLYFFNSVDDDYKSSHYAAINNYFDKKNPKIPKISRYVYSFVIGEPNDYNYLYVRNYDNQVGGVAPIEIKIRKEEGSYQSISKDILYDFEKVYVSFDENEMTKFDNIDHDGYVGDCSKMNGCLVCSDTECKICHETYYIYGSQCIPNECSMEGCGNCTSKTCIRCSDGSIPEENVCPSSNCNKFNGCSYCTGTKCLKCKEGFSLNENGQCIKVDCSSFDGCTSCSISECLICSNGKDPVDGLCVSTQCSSFEGCSECTEKKCVKCEDEYELVVGNCQKYDCSKMSKCTKCNKEKCLECANGIELINGSCKQETCKEFPGCTECTYAECLNCDKGYYLNDKGTCILNDCSSLLNCKKCDNGKCMESLDGLEMINGISYPTSCSEMNNCYRCDVDECVQCVNGEFSNQCEKVEKEIYCLRNDMFINKVKIGECHNNVDGTTSMYAYDGKGFVHIQYYGSEDCGLSGNPTSYPQVIDSCIEEINLEKINSQGFIYNSECEETSQNTQIYTSSECIKFGNRYIKTKQTTNKIFIFEYETTDCSGTPQNERNYEINSCSETLEGVKYQITVDSPSTCLVDNCETCVEGQNDKCEICMDGYSLIDSINQCIKCSEHCNKCSFDSNGKEKCNECEDNYNENIETGLCEKIPEETSDSSSNEFLILSIVLVLVLVI